MRQVFAVVNQKGGVGKTMLAFHLAREAARMGKKTLVIDMDPQGSMSSLCDIDLADMPFSTEQLLRGHVAKPVEIAELGFDLIPTATSLQGYEIDVLTEDVREVVKEKFTEIKSLIEANSRSAIREAKRIFQNLEKHAGSLNSIHFDQAMDDLKFDAIADNLKRLENSMAEGVDRTKMFTVLTHVIGPLQYDIIILDCQPSLGILGMMALVAATDVVVPMELSDMSLNGFELLMATFKNMKRLNPRVRLNRVVPNRVKSPMLAAEKSVLKRLQERATSFGVGFESHISDGGHLGRALAENIPVTDAYPKSKVAEEIMVVCKLILEVLA